MSDETEGLIKAIERRDAEITALRGLLDALISELASMYETDQRAAAYDRAHEVLTELRHQYGFKSDGRFRGGDAA